MDAKAFAAEWEAGWNSHDLDRILEHYGDDIVFRSRKAEALTGDGEVRGKVALAAYRSAALARQPNLAFRIEDLFVGAGVLTIVYRNHDGVRAAETLWSDADGRVRQAAACHPPEPD
ncbi:SnoaL-like protein [Palleronia aestuarii]|uniref:SnoaL-like protein n=1 Tax=Palleronia aestuarii TaxID=568105 RepID=A0A2W7P4Q4_9RHOB|nr:nuclear transport factor 2 family protein [Palleronia aestuarii]PZX18392.1 SnoaL-like protein [Palleronia aestuarii]